METLIGLHSSPFKIRQFDLTRFNMDSLNGDTKEFGLYFDFFQKPDNKTLLFGMQNNCRYGLRHADIAYMHLCKLKIDREKFIDSFEKMSFEKFEDLFSDFPEIPSDKILNAYSISKNNVHLFQIIIKYMIRNNYSYTDIADYLISKGYDGYIRGNDFGQIVIFNLQCIEIKVIITYQNQRDFRTEESVERLEVEEV